MARFYREAKEFRSKTAVILSEVTASQREAVTQSKLGLGTIYQGILTAVVREFPESVWLGLATRGPSTLSSSAFANDDCAHDDRVCLD
jgi:hypothetical protein